MINAAFFQVEMLCQTQGGNETLSGSRKRKLDLTESCYSGIEPPVYTHARLRVSHKSPQAIIPNNVIRASTIKLLDTYQRCGQKVII